MNSLNQQQTTQLINVLSDRERALREDIRREMNLQDDYVQLASEAPDAAVTRDIHELRAIELARKKMSSGTYGTCVSCGYDIPFERLQAIPTAERCAPCQQNFERTHHQDGMRGASM
jgi:RNA polymerase-binding transcription factor DksA